MAGRNDIEATCDVYSHARTVAGGVQRGLSMPSREDPFWGPDDPTECTLLSQTWVPRGAVR